MDKTRANTCTFHWDRVPAEFMGAKKTYVVTHTTHIYRGQLSGKGSSRPSFYNISLTVAHNCSCIRS